MTMPAVLTGLGWWLVALCSQPGHLWMTPTELAFALFPARPVTAADTGQAVAVVSDPSGAARCCLPARISADTVPASLLCGLD